MTLMSVSWLPVMAADLRGNATMHADMANTLMNSERYAEAIGEYQIALRLNPHSAVAATLFNNLGLCFRKLGQTQQAIASFQHAIHVQPGFEYYYRNLIQTYRQAGHLPMAFQTLRNIVTRNDHDAEAWFLLGLVLEEVQEDRAAQKAFSRFLELEPNSQLAEAARRHL
jgi:tetratricopeptide (TPR) repeat protein